MICPNCEQAVAPVHFYRSGKTRCRNRRTWTRARLWKLMGLLERGWSDARIAGAMGTTANAVNLARKRHGIPSRSDTLLSCRTAAELMGIGCSKTVTRWIERGWLRGTRGPKQGPHPQWQIRRADLDRFLGKPEHWHRWTPERIADVRLKEWATKLRGGVRFLTVGQAAWRCCVQPGTVHAWIAKGWLPAVRTGEGEGNHLIQESDLDAFAMPRIGGRRERAA